jgi:hypothetical protein
MKNQFWQAFSVLYRYPAFGRLRTLIVGLFPILYWFGLLELWLLFLLTFLAGMLVPATEVGTRSILSERCRLFIILALGESILVIAANFGELPSSVETVVAFGWPSSAALLCGGFTSTAPMSPGGTLSLLRATQGDWGARLTPTFTCRWWPASSLSPPRTS